VSEALQASDASAEALMGAVVDEFLDRLGRGERPDVEEYAREHPRLATVLRQMLPALRVMHLSAAAPHVQAAAAPAEVIEPEGPLGDFRIVREVGRGGMGVVYEAVQISLGRRVALKVLPFAAALDAKQLLRFKNEAQAAACLHHQHIVPVYGVGTERGVHYYAMQFIDGHTLAALIQELQRLAGLRAEDRGDPRGQEDTFRQLAADLSTARSTRSATFFRTVARLGAQAAEALEHAHQLGVVHRDVKPANLLIDGQGNLWVTDFGLARVQSDTRLTVTGDLVGTLRYMSPEQALAQPVGVDQRTDLYSLGATLYELLTLRPVFEGRDCRELLRQIAFEEPKPPRLINKAVPAELEIIALKAMAKEPTERYASAREMADDLGRFLRDEPIRARRPTLVQRARKWARRHRPAVWSAALSLLVLLAVSAGLLGWVLRDRSARRARLESDIRSALEEERQCRLEGRWPQALAAAKRAEALLESGGVEPELAERVRELQRSLAAEEADARLLARLEEIRFLQAEVKDGHFVLESALPHYRQAFGSWGLRPAEMAEEEAAELVQSQPPAVRGILVAALDHWLILARHKKAPEAGWLAQVLSQGDPDPWRRRVRAARVRNDRKALEQLAREVDAAAQPPEELFLLHMSLTQRGAREGALALLRRAQERFPGDFWINHDLGMALQTCQPPQRAEAIRFLTAAVAVRPESAGARFDLGKALLKQGRLDEAIGAFRKATELNGDYVQAHNDLGFALNRKGRLDEAVAAYLQALQRKPDFTLAHANLVTVLIDKGQVDEALEACRRAIRAKADQATVYFLLGVAQMRKGRVDEALTAYRRAIDRKPDYAEAHCNLGIALQRKGEFARAAAALKRGHDLGSRRRDWRYPSAAWVKQCQRLVELNGRLPAVLEGKAQPADAAERNEYARMCHLKKLYVASARLKAGAFRADPKLADDLAAGDRYDAACAAALACCGRGADAGKLGDRERARWREQALGWLRADLAAYAERLKGGKPADRVRVRRMLRHWQQDPDLAGIRAAAALAKLPAHEREGCEKLWAEVRALLAKAEAAP
jgi:serine/threonine protein kinase/Flp pilus assembly protein TadD